MKCARIMLVGTTLLLEADGCVDQIPDPVEDFKGFLKGVKKLLESEQKPYNPIAEKATPWADLRKLARAYRGRGKSCSIM
jgi:hypothetical protein